MSTNEAFNTVCAAVRAEGTHPDTVIGEHVSTIVERKIRAVQHALSDRAERERIEAAVAERGDLDAARAGWSALRDLKPGIDGVSAFDDLPIAKAAEYAVFAKAAKDSVPAEPAAEVAVGVTAGEKYRVVEPVRCCGTVGGATVEAGETVTVVRGEPDAAGDVRVRLGGGLTTHVAAVSLEPVPAEVTTYERGSEPFPVGSKVRIVGPNVWGQYVEASNFPDGDVLVVDDANVDRDGDVFARRAADKTESGYIRASSLELVEDNAPKFKVGDPVRILSGGGDGRIRHAFSVGTVGTVETERDAEGDYRVSRSGEFQYVNEADLELIESTPAELKAGDRVRVIDTAGHYHLPNAVVRVVSTPAPTSRYVETFGPVADGTPRGQLVRREQLELVTEPEQWARAEDVPVGVRFTSAGEDSGWWTRASVTGFAFLSEGDTAYWSPEGDQPGRALRINQYAPFVRHA